MEQTTPLNEILTPATTSEPAPQEPQTASEPVKETVSERPRGPDGKFAPKVAPAPEATGVTAEPPSAPVQQQREVPLQALIDQRLEARQAKQERDELRRQLEELKKPKQEPVDFYADPEAALTQRLQPFQQKFDQTLSTLTLRASKAEAIATHGRQAVNEMEAAIGEAMEAGDPEVHQLRGHLLQSDDPVGVAMQWYQRRKVLSEVGTDPAAYREKLKAEILAELKGEPQTPPPAPAVMPSNIAGARNVGTRAGPQWNGPTPLTDIFKK